MRDRNIRIGLWAVVAAEILLIAAASKAQPATFDWANHPNISIFPNPTQFRYQGAYLYALTSSGAVRTNGLGSNGAIEVIGIEAGLAPQFLTHSDNCYSPWVSMGLSPKWLLMQANCGGAVQPPGDPCDHWTVSGSPPLSRCTGNKGGNVHLVAIDGPSMVWRGHAHVQGASQMADPYVVGDFGYVVVPNGCARVHLLDADGQRSHQMTVESPVPCPARPPEQAGLNGALYTVSVPAAGTWRFTASGAVTPVATAIGTQPPESSSKTPTARPRTPTPTRNPNPCNTVPGAPPPCSPTPGRSPVWTKTPLPPTAVATAKPSSSPAPPTARPTSSATPGAAGTPTWAPSAIATQNATTPIPPLPPSPTPQPSGGGSTVWIVIGGILAVVALVIFLARKKTPPPTVTP